MFALVAFAGFSIRLFDHSRPATSRPLCYIDRPIPRSADASGSAILSYWFARTKASALLPPVGLWPQCAIPKSWQLPGNRPHHRQVLECASPLALATTHGFPSAREPSSFTNKDERSANGIAEVGRSPVPNRAPRLECGELAPAFSPGGIGQRQQAARTPKATPPAPGEFAGRSCYERRCIADTELGQGTHFFVAPTVLPAQHPALQILRARIIMMGGFCIAQPVPKPLSRKNGTSLITSSITSFG